MLLEFQPLHCIKYRLVYGHNLRIDDSNILLIYLICENDACCIGVAVGSETMKWLVGC